MINLTSGGSYYCYFVSLYIHLSFYGYNKYSYYMILIKVKILILLVDHLQYYYFFYQKINIQKLVKIKNMSIMIN